MSSTVHLLRDVASTYIKKYKSSTPVRVKLIDAYLVFLLLTGGLQLVYCFLVGTFPFNSFLSGLFCCIGAFVLGVSLRLQVGGSTDFKDRLPEAAFGDFVFCNIILFLATMNFMG
uniref:Dolichyl-diphosphooligosaccharide--protein glycosyltransferase subunit OST2 n=1 Tax=Fibrocapsa japonica TaxID=94617 RepID=A0A7S2V3K8_9STRA|mmetsp:Transcript_23091/g.33537  ORF Transcript_23091/g.33537 Transcript_23091/m.33537 type:complete len:115 (+) Transcript_23091:91-435(+)